MFKRFIPVMMSIIFIFFKQAVYPFPVGVALHKVGWASKKVLLVGDQHTAEIVFDEGIYNFTNHVEAKTGRLINGMMKSLIRAGKPIHIVFEQNKNDFKKRTSLPPETLLFVRRILACCPADSNEQGSATFIPADFRGIESKIVTGFCADYDFGGLDAETLQADRRSVVSCFASRAVDLDRAGENGSLITVKTFVRTIKEIPTLLRYQQMAGLLLGQHKDHMDETVLSELYKIWQENIIVVERAVAHFEKLLEDNRIDENMLLELALVQLVDSGCELRRIERLLSYDIFSTYANLGFLGNILAALRDTDNVCLVAGLHHTDIVGGWLEQLGCSCDEAFSMNLYKQEYSLNDVTNVDEFVDVACDPRFTSLFASAVEEFVC